MNWTRSGCRPKVQQATAAGPCQFVGELADPPGSSHNFWGLIAAGEAIARDPLQSEERAGVWASHQLAHELAGLRR